MVRERWQPLGEAWLYRILEFRSLVLIHRPGKKDIVQLDPRTTKPASLGRSN